MFDFLKNLFVSKPVEDNAGAQERPISYYHQVTPPSAPKLTTGARATAKSNGNGGGVHIPLQAVLSGLPLELKGRIKQSEVGEATISVALEKVLSQLSHGAVKISFGELRRAAPEVFSKETDRDQIQVALPLNEILSQLNPALLIRRQNQKQIEVPEEVSSPFGAYGQGLAIPAAPARPAAPVAPRAITPAAPLSAKPAPLAPLRPTPAHPRPASPAPAARTPIQPMPFRSTLNVAHTPPPPGATPAGFPPARPAVPTVRRPGASVPAPAAPQPASAHPFEAAVQPAHPADENAQLSVSLTALAETWPDALRQEIVQLNLVDAKVALPVATVEEALKRGKIAVTWKTLRSWIKPAALPSVSAHDAVLLDLPLKVVAPMFLARQKNAAKVRQRTEIDENIPNLFFGFPQPERSAATVATPGGIASPGAGPAPGPAVAKPVDTNYYVWDDTSETAFVDETEFKRRPSPGTTFVARYATPNEIVSRASALDGVAGALIALPDGLMVASRLSPDLNGDTLAAFLPHIFGKVSQCTKELRMGELNNLNFTVGNVPWKIFRVNAIFFAAFGRAGQPMPTSQLAALAAELDRKKQ
jgi:predicted regulator of Ras-like GTPase activity (Roadblock/LC7/MglB family)